jgi:hypothetical protein
MIIPGDKLIIDGLPQIYKFIIVQKWNLKKLNLQKTSATNEYDWSLFVEFVEEEWIRKDKILRLNELFHFTTTFL